MKFLHFFLLLAWIRIHWPDWIRIQSGYGSTTLVKKGDFLVPVPYLLCCWRVFTIGTVPSLLPEVFYHRYRTFFVAGGFLLPLPYLLCCWMFFSTGTVLSSLLREVVQASDADHVAAVPRGGERKASNIKFLHCFLGNDFGLPGSGSADPVRSGSNPDTYPQHWLKRGSVIELTSPNVFE